MRVYISCLMIISQEAVIQCCYQQDLFQYHALMENFTTA